MTSRILGFVFRNQHNGRAAAFYQALGLKPETSQHSGPVHFEVGPVSPEIVFELYPASPMNMHDALMIEVDSMNDAMRQVEAFGIVREVMRRSVDGKSIAFVRDPTGRSVMLIERMPFQEKSVTDGLHAAQCVPCIGNSEPLPEAAIEGCMKCVPSWKRDGNAIVRTFAFQNFMEAIAFINEVAAIAQLEDHHPDLRLMRYKNIEVSWTTFAAKGLTMNDFIMAAKTDRI